MIKDYIINRIKGFLSGIKALGEAVALFFKGQWGASAEAASRGVKDLVGVDAYRQAGEQGEKLAGKFKEGYDRGVGEIAIKNNAKTGATGSWGTPEGLPSADGGTSTLGNDGATSATVTSGLGSISGGGQTKHITVNIQKLVESINVHSKDVKEGAMDISRIVEEQLIKAIRGYEMAMSNGS